MRCQLLVVLLCVCLVAAQPPLPNIAYLGAGYDLLRGNPHTTDPTQGVDPGFQSFIFNMNNFTKATTPDNKYSIPYGVDVLMCDLCSVNSETSEFAGGNEYSVSLEHGVGGSIGLFGIHFSASEDWKNVYQESTSYQDVFMETEATCCAYTASILSDQPPALTPNFIDAVNQLPLYYDEAAYMNFLTTFGTHALTDMTMGGRFGMRSTFTSYSWSQMTSSSMERTISAGFSLFSFSAAASTMSASQKQQASDFQRFVSSTNMFETGGTIPANGSISAWSDAVSENPMPIYIDLMSIADIFSSLYFPNLNSTTLAALQNSTLTALNNYCGYLLSLGEVPACSIGPDPNFPPHSSFGGIYQNDDCNVDNSPNPYTGVMSCPSNCVEFPVARTLAATSKCGATVYLCLESNATDWDPIYNFGGMCQLSGTGIDNRVNPMTNAENCPPQYAPIPIGGTILPDDQSASGTLYTCLNADDVVPTWQPVGGFFQTDTEGVNCVVNLYTQAYSCPDGYSQQLYGLAMVAPNVAAAQFICINNNMLGLYLSVSETENDTTHYMNETYALEILEQARARLAASKPAALPNKISLN